MNATALIFILKIILEIVVKNEWSIINIYMNNVFVWKLELLCAVKFMYRIKKPFSGIFLQEHKSDMNILHY